METIIAMGWAGLGYVVAFALGILGGHFLWPKVVEIIKEQ